jgi:hypothetical protein
MPLASTTPQYDIDGRTTGSTVTTSGVTITTPLALGGMRTWDHPSLIGQCR